MTPGTARLKHWALLLFVHGMVLWRLWRLFHYLFWNILWRLYFEPKVAWQIFLKKPLDWIPWIILGVALVGVLLFSNWPRDKGRWLWGLYGKDPPGLIMSSYALIGLVTTIYFCFNLCVHLLFDDWDHYLKDYFKNSSVGSMVMDFVWGSLSFAIMLLAYFAIWKRLKVFFRPYYYYQWMIFGLMAALTTITSSGPLGPRMIFIIKETIRDPGLDLAMAWCFFRWNWFEATKVAQDPRLPTWMNQATTWWWVNGCGAAIAFFSFVMSAWKYFHLPH